jgi:hypothetical protein
MTPDKAYEILEPQDEAGARAVTEAHRRLMQKLHPDRGGTNYLAAKINPTKDLAAGAVTKTADTRFSTGIEGVFHA